MSGYKCTICDTVFEHAGFGDDEPACPKCNKRDTDWADELEHEYNSGIPRFKRLSQMFRDLRNKTLDEACIAVGRVPVYHAAESNALVKARIQIEAMKSP